MARLVHPIGYRFTSASGSVLASGSVETYLANTSTPQAIYQDPNAASALPNPTSLNASGQAQNASGQAVALFAPDVALKWVLKDSLGVVVNTIDDDGGADAATGGATAADGGMRNLLSNGEMRLWLDTSTPVDWSLDLSGATGTISRQAHTLGQTDVPGEPPYYLRLTITSSNADAGIYQDIDDVRTLAGQDAAASVYVRCSVTTTLRLALIQKFGSGGSPSTDVSASTDFSVSANVWTRLEMPKTLASIAGKIIGSNADSSLRFALTNPNNETFTLDVGGAQLERASEIGTLEKRLTYEDLLLAARPTFATAVITSADIDGGTIDATAIGATAPAAATVTSLNAGPLAGFRNRIINGDFRVVQRGTSVTLASVTGFGPDRWLIDVHDSLTHTLSQQAFSPGQTDVPGEPAHYLRWVTSGTTTSGTRISQRIEDVRAFAGQASTLSFYAKASRALSLTSRISQNFGSGGSSSVTGVSATHALTTSWQRFSRAITPPSIAGKTIGAGSYCDLNLVIPGGEAAVTIEIACVQWEPGAVATPFEARPLGLDEAVCRRYYQASVGAGSRVLWYGDTAVSGVYQAQVSFPSPMRAAPTVTLTDVSSFGFPAGAGSVAASTVGGFIEQRTADTARTPGRFTTNWIADAEL